MEKRNIFNKLTIKKKRISLIEEKKIEVKFVKSEQTLFCRN